MPNDAIGNDVFGMYEELSEAGYQAEIFTSDCHDSYKPIARPVESQPEEAWQSPDDVLIYHHAIGWPAGEEILRKTRNRVVIKYHNITPPRFFRPYAQNYVVACEGGIEATGRIARFRGATFWGDSEFNAGELIELGAPPQRCRSLAPWHRIEQLQQEPLDLETLKFYRDGSFNILFVGAIKPNKGHANALRAFAAYKAIYGGPARLILAGSFDPGLKEYYKAIQHLAQAAGVAADTVFVESVSGACLRTLYQLADLFLCVSEHEGFCVPLVEAMAFRAPILAWGATAVAETAGDAGIVWEEFDPLLFAESMDRIRNNPALAGALAARGRLRYEQCFHPSAIRGKMRQLMREVEGETRG